MAAVTRPEGLPDWVQVGAEVAAVQGGGAGGDSYTKVTISRIGATQIVTSNGAKWRVRDLGLVGHRDQWTSAPQLRQLTDPRVREAGRRRTVKRLLADLTVRVKDIDPSGDVDYIALALERLSRDAAKAADWCRAQETATAAEPSRCGDSGG